MTFTREHYEILDHTVHRAQNNHYCGDSKEMQELVGLGLMRSLGKVNWCPDEYFTITTKGTKVLNEGLATLTAMRGI